MIILDRKYSIKELHEINSFVNGFIKGVVIWIRSWSRWMQICIMNWQII